MENQKQIEELLYLDQRAKLLSYRVELKMMRLNFERRLRALQGDSNGR
jgi:hypothetical protein